MNLPDQSAAGVGISCLAGVAAEFIENSLVPSTRQSYSVGQEEYKEFCAHLNVPLPADETVLIMFTARLLLHLAPSSVRSYLTGVRHWQVSQGLGDPLAAAL